MRRWILPAALALTMCGRPVQASSKIGVYFDEAGETNRLQVDFGHPFHFFISVSGISGGIHAVECLVEVDPRITVTGRSMRGPNPIDVGEGDDNWVVGLGGAVPVAGTLPVFDYDAVLLTQEEGLWIGLGPAQTTEVVSSPRYMINLDHDIIYDFDEVGGAVLNAEIGSWGELKKSYENQ